MDSLEEVVIPGELDCSLLEKLIGLPIKRIELSCIIDWKSRVDKVVDILKKMDSLEEVVIRDGSSEGNRMFEMLSNSKFIVIR